MNRTIVDFVSAQPIGGVELAYLGLDLELQCLKPAELFHPARQPFKIGDDQRTHRRVTLSGLNPRSTVDIIRNRYRDVLHSFTVTRFL
jgi:hypothetical protein